jgi:hypothetical protein
VLPLFLAFSEVRQELSCCLWAEVMLVVELLGPPGIGAEFGVVGVAGVVAVDGERLIEPDGAADGLDEGVVALGEGVVALGDAC